jgi:hypothetical protein
LEPAASVQNLLVAYVPDSPMLRAYKRVGSQPQLCAKHILDATWYRSFSGAAQAVKGSRSIFEMQLS